MAGLKKKKKEKSGNPNIVLIIFLVFFFLVSIGLGIWGYYGYAGQEDLRRSRLNAESSAKVEKASKRYYSMLYRELRLAVGEKLDEKEIEFLNVDRDEFAKDNGDFKAETDKEAAKALLDDLRKKLGVGKDGRDFESTLMKEWKAAQEKAKDWEGKATAAVAKIQRTEDISKTLTKTQDDSLTAMTERIGKENAAILLAAKEKFEAFQKVADNNMKLTAELEAKKTEIINEREDKDKVAKQLTRKINALLLDLKDKEGAGGAGPLNAGGGGGDFFPLVLDISPGKPLWDQPVGRIIRVDLDSRQVTINLGTAQGARPELTFNIFGAGASGRAEKQLKGSIEVIKVVDANTSIARITSLYDVEGHEILMNLQTRSRGLREAEAPIREGDLLFNLFWGTRVAIAGYVSITGEPSDNPAEQKRHTDDFVHLLRRNGMQVDALVDLTSGNIEGNITSKTRYLIRGDDLRVAGDKAAPKMADGDKEKEKEKDNEPAKEVAAPNAERNDQINKSSQTLRNDAKDKGLLMISAKNFATVIGYRRARSANSVEKSSDFRPSLPFAGSGDTGVVVRPREEDKKAPEEKKDGN
jgi:hypothetical protein